MKRFWFELLVLAVASIGLSFAQYGLSGRLRFVAIVAGWLCIGVVVAFALRKILPPRTKSRGGGAEVLAESRDSGHSDIQVQTGARSVEDKPLMVGKKLYVGNLAYGVTSSDLEKMFSQFGTVKSAEVFADRDTGRSKGFGVVDMNSEAEARAAIDALNGQEHDGRRLTVNEARPSEPRPGGGGRAGGWRRGAGGAGGYRAGGAGGYRAGGFGAGGYGDHRGYGGIFDIATHGRLDKTALIDQHVRFTVYRPDKVRPQTWYTMLAFAYRAADIDEGGGDIRKSFEEVEQRAAHALGPQMLGIAALHSDSQQPIPREGMLRIVPRFEKLEFNPPERSFVWVEKIHGETFRFRAPAMIDGQTIHGRMEVYLDMILIGEVGLAIGVDSSAAAVPDASLTPHHGQRYRKVFASNSHKDLSIVQQFDAFVQAYGDEFVRDWTHLRSGEVWSEGLQSMISAADVFQLFWSRNSMDSSFVRQEWEYSLGLNRESFVRPVYWEEPMPERPEAGLPPDALRRLHFHLFTPRIAVGFTAPHEDLVGEMRAIDHVIEGLKQKNLRAVRSRSRRMVSCGFLLPVLILLLSLLAYAIYRWIF
jgi:hypothetical protein